MARGALFRCFLILLIYGHHQVSSMQPTYKLEDAIEDLNVFIPGSKLVLTTAIKFWSVYNEVREMINPNMTAIDGHLQEMNSALIDISDSMSEMSEKLNTVSDDVKETKDLISNKLVDVLPKYTRLQKIIEKIKSRIHKINGIFEDTFTIKNTGYEKYENKTLLDMVDSIIQPGASNLNTVLHEIYELIMDNDSRDKFLDKMANKRIAFSMMCDRKESAHHEIKRLYQMVTIAETKNLLMAQFAYSIQNFLNNKPDGNVNELKNVVEKFSRRTSKMTAAFKNAMSKAPRDFWYCDPDEHTEGSTYAKLSPIFQAYIMNEKDSGHTYYEDKHNKCSDSCKDHSETRDLCRSDHCKEYEKKCSGLVRDCASSAKKLNICYADKESSRRYEFIEFISNENRKVYGKQKSCKSNNTLTVTRDRELFWILKCDYCICTCEDINLKMDRYFSLKNVTSDIQNNYVVTGVRFAKKNNIFHIQIQQGKLLENGNIDKSTVDWKPVHNFTVFDKHVVPYRDYYKISWIDRSVYLDTLDAPLNKVLTGLRFQVDGNNLKFEIQMTPFNFSNGELKKHESKWISNLSNDRTEINLDNRDLGTSTTHNSYHYEEEGSNQFFKFTKSSLESDAGQTVVPFIDLQTIESTPFVPLSGAGLILRNTQESAGFLSFKLLTYNYAPYMKG